MVLLMLMFVGGCAGSTAGGLKVSRLTILCKDDPAGAAPTLRPRMVDVIKLDGHHLSEQTAHSIVVYFALYMLCVEGCWWPCPSLHLTWKRTYSPLSPALTTWAPASAWWGPWGFLPYSPAIKLFLCAGMLLGRLEIYPMLLLFVPAAWRKK